MYFRMRNCATGASLAIRKVVHAAAVQRTRRVPAVHVLCQATQSPVIEIDCEYPTGTITRVSLSSQHDLYSLLNTTGCSGGYLQPVDAPDQQVFRFTRLVSGGLYRPVVPSGSTANNVTIIFGAADDPLAKRKTFKEFDQEAIKQILADLGGRGFCMEGTVEPVLMRIQDFQNDTTYYIYTDSARKNATLVADIKKHIDILNNVFEQQAHADCMRRAQELMPGAAVQPIRGTYQDDRTNQDIIRIHAGAVVGDTLLLGVAKRFATPDMVEAASAKLDDLFKVKHRCQHLAALLANVKHCQITLYSEAVSRGVDEKAVIYAAEEFGVGVALTTPRFEAANRPAKTSVSQLMQRVQDNP